MMTDGHIYPPVSVHLTKANICLKPVLASIWLTNIKDCLIDYTFGLSCFFALCAPDCWSEVFRPEDTLGWYTERLSHLDEIRVDVLDFLCQVVLRILQRCTQLYVTVEAHPSRRMSCLHFAVTSPA